MKKRLTAIILAAAVTMLAACSQQNSGGSNGGSENDSTTTTTTTTTTADTTTTTADTTTTTTSETETSESPENTPEPNVDENPNTNEDENGGNQSENDTSGNSSESERLTEVVLNSVEFPSTMRVEDEEMIKDMGLNLDDIEEYCVTQQMMSVHLIEVIIAKPKEGKAESVLESLQARKDALINTFAYYPEQEESANATVVGQKGDYVYLICHWEAADAEKELLKNIT